MESRIEKQIQEVEGKLTRMGLLAEQAIEKAMDSLLNRDDELAKKVIEEDAHIDRLDKQIEDLSLRILLLDSPVSSDFLRVSAALKMITDLERIGDYAVDIAEEVISFPNEPYAKGLDDLTEMGNAAVSLVHEAVKTFINGDIDSARKLPEEDDKLDFLFLKIKKELLSLIKKKEDFADQAIIFMMIAKYLERIGDHAVNIGEWVDYGETGTHSVS
ncbi:MAG: phosphate signaling complex protein PhoU [Bacillota bacterium]|nr:phosphate signaling complex protein PhoU [Bacillota bacterium]